MHEFQRLKKRLREVERQLERERGSVERERECRVELQRTQAQLEELRETNQVHLNRLKDLTLQVSQASGEQVDSRVALESECERSLQLRSVCERQRVLLHDAGPVLRLAAAELRGVKQELSLLSDDWNINTTLILQHCSTAWTDHVVLQQEVSRAKEEAAKLQQDVKKLQDRLHTSQLETQMLENRIQNQKVLQNQNQQAYVQMRFRLKTDVSVRSNRSRND
ncbi:leucine-, glutamate- and lysine-rich protein 1 isoform X1 [Silurus meridionalis]|nr:leucine-, glutamate- and lysine-rich protein 1 isoform X1 [Silurus meridionalis]